MKIYVIGLTTYREIVRRFQFWLLLLAASALLVLFCFIPYYTFGEDIKMVKDQGLAVIMLSGLLVGLFAASSAIADEIEGKTAMTLLSKPIRRRDFIIGKFAGIMAAVGLLFVILGVVMALMLFYKAGYEAGENKTDMPSYSERLVMLWQTAPALLLTYFQVTILCALSVAFSTRLPLHLNLTACIIIFFLGHLAPQLVWASTQGQLNEVVRFMAELFALVLPGLEYFNVGPAISTDARVPWLEYVLPCFGYTILYSSIALLLALFLFEDRDLA
ncbi:MAG: ABC transporter permease subunit [Planctomycetota bacterium]